jgi:hypothetical protein
LARVRKKGIDGADFTRGYITPAGMVRCACHGQHWSLTQFEAHAGSKMHRPTEHIHINSIDMSMKVSRGCKPAEQALGATKLYGMDWPESCRLRVERQDTAGLAS